MKLAQLLVSVSVGVVCVAASQARAADVSNRDFQAVNANGVSTWTGTYPITITGVILNNPEDMLDTTYDSSAVASGSMGAQWQLFIQGIGTDHNGTALWMGQNYNSLGAWIPAGNSYDQAAWTTEMIRVNYDETTGHQFRQGDLVTVTAGTSLFYGGKRNVNESHRTTTANDFTVSLVTADYGLPTASRITLSDLYVDPGVAGYDAAYPMFDASRNTGAEYYQGTYVRLNGLTLTDADGWDETAWGDRLCTVTDGAGHTFTLRMPLSDLGDAPAGMFDVYGIINQESGSGSNGRYGYEIFVTGVVPEPATLSVLLVGISSCLRKRRGI